MEAFPPRLSVSYKPTEGAGADARWYAAILVFAALSYLSVVPAYRYFTAHVLPTNDPFTYTIGLFEIVDMGRHDYLGTLWTLLRGNWGGWYRYLFLTVASLAPILDKDPVSISIVNYLAWALGSVAFYRLGRTLHVGCPGSFVVALIPWIWPVNFGFSDYDSIPVLALDSSFNGLLLFSLGNTFAFAIDPSRRSSALLAGLSIGVAMWGRGNAITVVGLVTLWPCLLAAVRAWRRGYLLNLAIAAITAIALTVEYYATYWNRIVTYYSDHVVFVERHAWNFADARKYIYNIPGYMIWRVEDSAASILLTLLCHLAIAGAVWRGWSILRKSDENARGHVILAGAFIYIVTYMIDLALWTDPLLQLTNSLLVWRPMLAGATVAMVGALAPRLQDLTRQRAIAAAAALLVWGVIWTAAGTPEGEPGAPVPTTVATFAERITTITHGGKVGVLWYGNWNPNILRYYRLKAGLGDAPPYYMGKNWNALWAQAHFSDEDRERVKAEIREQFTRAAVVIVPERLDDYAADELQYPLYRFRAAWAPWLSSPEAPLMRVLMTLQESDRVRLLVLCRASEDWCNGPKWLPYTVGE